MRGGADGAGAPGRTLVALLVSDAALEERLAAALADAPGLTISRGDASTADEADVVISDGAHVSRPTILVADAGADAATGEVRAVLPVTVEAALLRAAVAVVAAGYALVPDRDAFGDGEPEHLARGGGSGQEVAIALTPRESEVLNLIAQGASNKLVARRLGISVHTAKYHVASLLLKLGAQNRSDAVAIGMREGLVFM
jgi:DNA-binding CsgD family transcriptional regulator